MREQGGSAGNGRLRGALGWDEDRYDTARAALIAAGAIEPGRGRGGSVALAGGSTTPKAEPAPKPEARQPHAAKSNGGNLGFEAELFKAADKLRGNMEPSDYKHVALGLIFLKHISDGFEAKRAALRRGEEEGLTQEEIAFYDALAENESAVEVMGNDSLKVIAHELLESLKGNVTVDWSHRESARARMRVLVKRILRRHGYSPDLQDAAVQTVLRQAEALSASWAG